MEINAFLQDATELNASDVHLTSNHKPTIRLDGELQALGDYDAIDSKALKTLLKGILTEEQSKQLDRELELDFSYAIDDVARFRVNLFHDAEGLSGAFRIIPPAVISMEELALPDTLKTLCDLPHGLVLVTGPTGSGKSTTLAAMIDYINERKPTHILTLEDPIEYTYTNKEALISQREVHHHTKSFSNALRAALREDPDIILVGEMRDLETIRLALTAAETGHLVFATLHTSSAAKTINRVIDVFPGDEKSLVRSMLSESLRAVVAQVLVKKTGGGRAAAHEIMLCTPAIRNMIREDKVPQIFSAIQTGQAIGMQTLEKGLQNLADQGIIERGDINQYL
jgi:twitching motility protein PilT